MKFEDFIKKPSHSMIILHIDNKGYLDNIYRISKEIKLSYSYSYWCINDLNQAGLVNKDGEGRNKKITLTAKGKEIAVSLQKIQNTLYESKCKITKKKKKKVKTR